MSDLSMQDIERALNTLQRQPSALDVAGDVARLAQMLATRPEPMPPMYVGPWIEVPPPTVREGRAREWKRQTRADRKKMRQRRRGDRAGRPL